MLYSIKNRDDLEKLEELASLQNQVEEVQIQDKLIKQNFHEHTQNVFEPVIFTIKNTCESLAKTLMESSIKKNQALENLNNKLLEVMNDRGILAFYLMSLLSKITNLEKTTQLKLVKDSNSNRNNDLLTHNTIPITLSNILLTFRDTGEEFELQRDLLKVITNKNYNVDLASLAVEKLLV